MDQGGGIHGGNLLPPSLPRGEGESGKIKSSPPLPPVPTHLPPPGGHSSPANPNIPTLPKILPPPPIGKEKKKKGVRKKWTVDLGKTLGDFDMTVCKAADISSEALENRLVKGISDIKKSSDGSSGVIFLKFENDDSSELVVLKSSSSLGQEWYGSALAHKLGMKCPRIRIISWRDRECFLIKKAIAALCGVDPRAAESLGGLGSMTNGHGGITWMKVHKILNRPHHGIMQFVNGKPLSSLLQKSSLTASSLRDIGRICAFDALTNNSDRCPFGDLFNNSGNAENVMLCGNNGDTKRSIRSSNTKTMHLMRVAVGIDNRVVPLSNRNQVQQYVNKIEKLVSQIKSKGRDASCFRNLLSFLQTTTVKASMMSDDGKSTLSESQACSELFGGFLELAQAAAKLEEKDFQSIATNMAKAVTADWEGVWRKAVDSIHPAFFATTARSFLPLLDVKPIQS